MQTPEASSPSMETECNGRESFERRITGRKEDLGSAFAVHKQDHGNRYHDFEAALCATGMVPAPKRFDFDHHWAMLRHQYAPYCQPHFHFTPDYLKQGFDYSKPSNPNLRHLAIPPQWIWLQRLQWGLHSVLMHLQAEGNFQELFLTSLDLAYTPLPLDEDR